MRLILIALLVACSSPAQSPPPPLTHTEPEPVVIDTPRYSQPPPLAQRDVPPPPTASPEPRIAPPSSPAEKKGKSADAGPRMDDESAAPKSEASRGAGIGDSAHRMRPPPREERPGLGTTWGEQRHSSVNEVPFERASNGPTFSGTLYYNDRHGAESMARYNNGWAQQDRAVLYLARGITMSLKDEYGSSLPGFRSGNKTYAVGENGRRYTIVIENRTATRFEAVVSVDGLDVIDGRSASYGKRGYLIDPYGRIEIEGFRSSADAVAAFRFGSVRDSYASQMTGSDRNVGVIGIAAFAERQQMQHWSYVDAERRHQADPFPSKWSPPPSPLNHAH